MSSNPEHEPALELTPVEPSEDHTDQGTEEKSTWFATLSSLIAFPAPSTSDLLQQISMGIRLATKSTAKEVPVRMFDHILHQFQNPKWQMTMDVKEYCAGAFQDLRELYGISANEYITEWTLSKERLQASEGAGKSGALFGFSTSKKFIFKTIFRSEVETLVNMMKQYHKYCHKQLNTLIMKMMGLYCFSKPGSSGSETYLLVFNNVLWSGSSKYDVDELFDLKGRRTKTLRFHDEEGEHEKGVRKDKHLTRLFYTGEHREKLLEQVRSDVEFLQKHNLMDYSLLVGVHHLEDPDEEIEKTPDHPALMGKSIFREYHGGFPSHGEIYFVGIIDCLTFYGAAKKVAHSFKSLLWNKEQLSTVQAQFYADRFLLYMDDIFAQGSPSTVEPFLPCAATQPEESLTLVVRLIRDIFNRNKTEPSELLESSDFTNSYHTVSIDDVQMALKSYAPKVFARLRQEWNCDTKSISDDFNLPVLQIQANTMQICGEGGVITGLNVPSNSKRYILETVQQRDIHMFFSFFPKYVDHMLNNPDTLITKLLGIYKLNTGVLAKSYVLLLENPEYISDRFSFVSTKLYTLQGVKVQQPVAPVREAFIPPSRPILCLDSNLDRTFSLWQNREILVNVIKQDVEFLKENNMILYNLVIYVGNIVPASGDNIESLVEKENPRRLSQSAFGEWIVLGGISNTWKHFGVREQLLSTSFSLLGRNREYKGMTDPQYYAERFLEMVDCVLTA